MGYSLFQMTTLEGWPDTADVLGRDWQMVFFVVCFLLLAHFTIINLLVGVICEHVQEVSCTEDVDFVAEFMRKREDTVEKLREVFDILDINGDGVMTKDEFHKMLDQPDVVQEMQDLQIDRGEMQWLFETLDV